MTTSLTIAGCTATLTCHMAMLSGTHRRNSAAAILECFEANATRIEIDVHSLDGPDYIVFHERRLETETDGSGSVGRATPDTVRALRFHGDAGGRPPLLSEVVEMARGSDTQVQLDLKDWRAMPPERILTLLKTIEPIHDRIIVSAGQDWNLRRLHHMDPALAIGFDPGHYLDFAIEGAALFLPRTMGAYGYRDDHPMAFGRTEPVTDYLHDRMEMLVLQVPGAREFFLSFLLILQMLDDGFDAAAWLHERAIEVTAWTPDYAGPDSVRWIERLIAAGVDHITTNTIPAWTAAVVG
jgi:glycerophosphoryl diester phosphodiesterase